MKSLIFALLFVFAPAVAQARVDRVDIVQYGIYSADVSSSSRDERGVLLSVATFKHAVTTTTVPAQHGVWFGLDFVVVGAPSMEEVKLHKVVVFPKGGLTPTGAAKPLLTSESDISANIGVQRFSGYGFDDPWELVPGEWRIQLWSGGKMLAEKVFNVVADGAGS